MYKFNRGLSSRYSAYIKNNRKAEGSTGSVIPLLLSPNSLSETLSANYDQQNVPGHRAPIISFSYTGARQVSLSYTVVADHVPAGYSMSSYLQALKDLEYPIYDASVVYAPSCTLVLPNLSLEGVCTSVTIDYKTDRTLQNGSMSAEVSLSFTEVKDTLNGYVNISLESKAESSGNEFYDELSTNVSDKKTPDVKYEDKMSVYGEGTNQSSPLEVNYYKNSNGGASWYSYNSKKMIDVDLEILKYNVYGDISNVKVDGICLSCSQSFKDKDDTGILGHLGNHFIKDHGGVSCSFKLTYHGKTKNGSRVEANTYRYIKAKTKD